MTDFLQQFPPDQEGWVLLIHAADSHLYRIDQSVNPAGHLQLLQQQFDVPLQIIKSYWSPRSVEDQEVFHIEIGHRLVSDEWFDLAPRPDIPPGMEPDDYVAFIQRRFAEGHPFAARLFGKCYELVLEAASRSNTCKYGIPAFDPDKFSPSLLCTHKLLHKPHNRADFLKTYNFLFQDLPSIIERTSALVPCTEQHIDALVTASVQSFSSCLFGEVKL